MAKKWTDKDYVFDTEYTRPILQLIRSDINPVICKLSNSSLLKYTRLINEYKINYFIFKRSSITSDEIIEWLTELNEEVEKRGIVHLL